MPGSQRKQTFANQCQGFHNVMLLLENIVLFHSSHHPISHRDTRRALLPMSPWKKVSGETPLSASQAIYTPLYGGSRGQHTVLFLFSLLSSCQMGLPILCNRSIKQLHHLMPKPSYASLPRAEPLPTPSQRTHEKNGLGITC